MIIPALDLIEGQVVRLYQGDYGQVTEYKVDPAEQFNLYHQAGAGWLHLVDLTGAKNTAARQLNLIARLLASTPANIQIGGGVRSEQDVVDLLEAGAQRVVVGSTAVKQPQLVKSWIEKYGAEKIVLALDINIDEQGTRKVAISGWQEDSGVTIEALIDDYLTVGLQHDCAPIFPAMARWPVRTLSCIAISVVNIHKCSSNRPVALVHLPILRH